MKIFQASLFLPVLKKYHELFPDEPLNVLVSLAYNQAERKGFLVDCRYMMDEVIGDSGAWSVAQGNSDITLEEVIATFKMKGHLFNRYFSFDTDFSIQGFENNIAHQLKMEKAGLNPMPVIHNFFNDEIPYYLKSGKYEWLALGSSQSTNLDDIRYAVDQIKTWGDQNIRIHLFGSSKFEWLINLPIAAGDTTSWAQAGKFGRIFFWNPHEIKLNKTHAIYVGGRMKNLEDDKYHFVTYPWRRELEEYLDKAFHFTYQDLCGYDDKHFMQVVNTRFYVELEKRINAERVKRGIALE